MRLCLVQVSGAEKHSTYWSSSKSGVGYSSLDLFTSCNTRTILKLVLQYPVPCQYLARDCMVYNNAVQDDQLQRVHTRIREVNWTTPETLHSTTLPTYAVSSSKPRTDSIWQSLHRRVPTRPAVIGTQTVFAAKANFGPVRFLQDSDDSDGIKHHCLWAEFGASAVP